MTTAPMGAVLHHLRRLTARQHEEELSDGQLLERFVRCREESAFAALLRRHGAMVLGVCRGVLRHQQDAEDAFQAAFLILAQKAASIRQRQSVGGWLHEVAYRVALKAQRSAARRRHYERRTPEGIHADPLDDLTVRELRQALHEELRQLPEKYRAPLVLCYLEGKTQDEAGRQLGWPSRRVKDRLQRGRELLRRRLSKRGLAPTAALGAALFAADSLSARVPSALASATLRGVALAAPIAPAVAALAKAGLPILSASKGKLAVAILLAVATSGSLVGWYGRASGPLAATTEPPKSPVSSKPLSPAEQGEMVTVTGRVLDPDGKPLAGAALYAPPLPQKRGITDAEGRFRLRLPRFAARRNRSDGRSQWNVSLVARADGFGLAWAEVPSQGKPPELTLRLVKDQPIEGRVLNTEGKPLAGVRLGVVELVTTPGERLDAFLNGWKQGWNNTYYPARERCSLTLEETFLSTTTDAKGRFQLRGVGEERIVQIQTNGRGIAQELLYVVTRPGFDPAPINKAVPKTFRAPTLHGPRILHVAGPGRAIEGVIREVDSGKPVAGMTVSVLVSLVNYAHAVSDSRGRFRLDGIPKQAQYWLQTEPGGVGPWMGTAAFVPDVKGLETLKVELTVGRGVVVTGRTVDRATGKGVPSEVRSAPLPGNSYCDKPGYDLYRFPAHSTPTDAEGRFRLVVIPGKSVLLARASAVERAGSECTLNPFMQPELSAEDGKLLSVRVDLEGGRLLRTGNNKEEYFGHLNACQVLHPSAGVGEIHQDIFLDRGRTLTVHLQDDKGKALTGCVAGGLMDHEGNAITLTEASCTVYALNPKRPRKIAFVHPQRRLVGLLTVRGDEKEPLTVRLKPTGVLAGRLLDASSQPLAGIRIGYYLFDNRAALNLDFQRRLRQAPIVTDADGRFRIDGMIPDLEIDLLLRKDKGYLGLNPPLGRRKVQSGKTLDLGDLRTKPIE